MTKLTVNVIVRGEDGQPVVLFAGDELPTWAKGLVGAHALADEPTKPAASPRKKPVEKE